MAVTHRDLTLDQFLALPEEKPALEYFAGVITQKMSPEIRHGSLQVEVVHFINSLARPPRLGRAFSEIRITFSGQKRSVVPDVSFYRWDRIPADEHGDLPEGQIFTPPDIAVEIHSPGQTIRELVEKCRFFAANGVPLSVLVLPRRRAVRLFRPGAESLAFTGDQAVDLSDVVPDLRFTVAELFNALRARPD